MLQDKRFNPLINTSSSGANLEIINKIENLIGGFNEFTYDGEILTNKSIYEDNTKNLKLFNIDFTYTDDKLTQKTITEISSGDILTYTYNYSGDTLISVNYS